MAPTANKNSQKKKPPVGSAHTDNTFQDRGSKGGPEGASKDQEGRGNVPVSNSKPNTLLTTLHAAPNDAPSHPHLEERPYPERNIDSLVVEQSLIVPKARQLDSNESTDEDESMVHSKKNRVSILTLKRDEHLSAILEIAEAFLDRFEGKFDTAQEHLLAVNENADHVYEDQKGVKKTLEELQNDGKSIRQRLRESLGMSVESPNVQPAEPEWASTPSDITTFTMRKGKGKTVQFDRETRSLVTVERVIHSELCLGSQPGPALKPWDRRKSATAV